LGLPEQRSRSILFWMTHCELQENIETEELAVHASGSDSAALPIAEVLSEIEDWLYEVEIE
jgi:hypothetical protein